MLGQRRRRWSNIKPALSECVVSDEDNAALSRVFTSSSSYYIIIQSFYNSSLHFHTIIDIANLIEKT